MFSSEESPGFFIDLPFTSPLTNAAGMLGFNPNPRGIDLSLFGGFLTNPISMGSRTAAGGTRLVRFPSGVLLHTGYPNRGARKIISKYRENWARSTRPVIVHLLASGPDEMFQLVRLFEDVEGVAGVELGLPEGVDKSFARELVQSAVGELPVIVRTPPGSVLDLVGEIRDSGASALSFGPFRGSYRGPNAEIISGRIFGPSIFPQSLEILRESVGTKLPILFAGGVENRRQVDLALEIGAEGVQIDLALWKPGALTALKESSSVRH